MNQNQQHANFQDQAGGMMQQPPVDMGYQQPPPMQQMRPNMNPGMPPQQQVAGGYMKTEGHPQMMQAPPQVQSNQHPHMMQGMGTDPYGNAVPPPPPGMGFGGDYGKLQHKNALNVT
ncbi:hypothetical protein Ciccas_001446 [Cichlidogyrus casuarinus]|uniref:Uncharacterized protein n=1 Tax=Cichlidogyrus casuarinus TaxID=1844966 RepID=A0ABD2QMB4_9PLAT